MPQTSALSPCRLLPAFLAFSLLLALVSLRPEASRAQKIDSTDRADRAAPGRTVVTAQRNTPLRKGPGSFHPVISVLKKDVPLTVLNEKQDWLRVELPDDRTGWIANVSIRSQEASQNPSPATVPEEWVETDATQTGVTAAIRGFQMHAEDLDDADVDRLTTALQQRPSISARDVEQFRIPLRAPSRTSDLTLRDLSMDLPPYTPSVEEKQLGFAVAARLAAQGLVEAPRVRRYVALIAEQLTRNTPYYHVNFDVLILDGEGPDAFACPGGIIFLTRGVFSHFENEAQLAGLVAHEIGHIVRRHGTKERDERAPKRTAQQAFAELEDETGDGGDQYEKVEERLNALIQNSYRRVANDRLLAYEKEADRIAAALLEMSGYTPMGIVEAGQHIAALRSQNSDLFTHDYLDAKNIRVRLQEAQSFIEAHSENASGRRLDQRFRAYAKELR